MTQHTIRSAAGSAFARLRHVSTALLSSTLTAAALAVAGLTSTGSGPIAPAYAQSADPCSALAASAPERAPTAAARAAAREKAAAPQHDDRWRHLDGLWAHRAALTHHRVREVRTDIQAQDVGEIAVLQDAGDLVISPNAFDLRDAGLRFAPNRAGGYDVSPTAFGFRQPLGAALTLADDDAREIALPFEFTLFGRSYASVFVNSDGNLTFGQSDTASTERSVSRWLTGAPRIAPLFADLDPSAGGRVVTSGDARAFSVTWCGVREFDSPRAATVQVTLGSDGTIDMQLSALTTVESAVIGVSPGQTSEFSAVDLTAGSSGTGSRVAIGERFTDDSDLDIVAVARRFLASHPDQFDNLVIFSDTSRLAGGTFAFEVSVANRITGLNMPVFDNAAEYGSGGQLQSMVNMDALGKYPDEPRQKFLGENSTLSVMGQEIGHRWLAFLLFRDASGRPSRDLLGRDSAHWSFFFNSDASVMEGNRIQDLGGGTFRTVGAVEHYSLLDQYAMGLVDRREVPPSFYVENPFNVVPARTATSAPQAGVTFNGTRRDVSIDDVIAALGPRAPSAAESQRVYRQAFIYVASMGREVDPAALQKIDRIRVAWDQFFSAATDSRMRVETRLAAAGTSD